MGHRKPVRRPLARRSHAYLRPLFILLGTPSDTTAGQVVRRHLNGDLVAGKNADKVHAELARDMRQNLMAVGKLYLKHCIGQRLYDGTLDFDHIGFCQVLSLLVLITAAECG